MNIISTFPHTFIVYNAKKTIFMYFSCEGTADKPHIHHNQLVPLCSSVALVKLRFTGRVPIGIFWAFCLSIGMYFEKQKKKQ